MRLPSTGYINRILKNAYSAHDTEIQFKRYLNTRPSNLYGERLGKPFGEPITVLGYFEKDPTSLTLQDIGWSRDTVSVVARFPFIQLLEAGLANEDGSLILNHSDRMISPHGEEFEIKAIECREPFRNGQPTFVWIGGKDFISGR